MDQNKKRIAMIAFAMYFLTGASVIVVGCSLPHLMQRYGLDVSYVVMLGSSFALGRVCTAYLLGKLVQKKGPKFVLGVGVSCLTLFLLGLSVVDQFYLGLLCACFGGIGMAAQDCVCPCLLSLVYGDGYASMLSIGQALFGLGLFATPFLMGLCLKHGLAFYVAYYVLLVIPCIVVPLMVVTSMDGGSDVVSEVQVKELGVKDKRKAMGLLMLASAMYSATFNTLTMYTSSFALEMGMDASSAAFLLTAFNVGAMCGSFVFSFVLKKMKAENVLCMNNCVAFVVVLCMVVFKKWYYAGLFVTGFFIGVLFSVMISLATRVDTKRMSVASSLIATSGGCTEIVNPLLTGMLVSSFGVSMAYPFALGLLVVSIVVSVGMKRQIVK